MPWVIDRGSLYINKLKCRKLSDFAQIIFSTRVMLLLFVLYECIILTDSNLNRSALQVLTFPFRNIRLGIGVLVSKPNF